MLSDLELSAKGIYIVYMNICVYVHTYLQILICILEI